MYRVHWIAFVDHNKSRREVILRGRIRPWSCLGRVCWVLVLLVWIPIAQARNHVVVAEVAAANGAPAHSDSAIDTEPTVAKKTAPAAVKDPGESVVQRIEIPPEIEAVLAKKYPESPADLRAIEKQVRRVLVAAFPATVGLQIGMSAGSGVLVSDDGLILTAGHVANIPNQDVWVLLADGRRVRAKTLGMNRDIDSGMIRITEEGSWPYVPMAKGNAIQLGEWVLALGHPGGYRSDRSAPVRLGRIVFHNGKVIRTDCTLVGGDSGGPLFNMRGEVVAIHSRIGMNIRSNFHVPIATYHTTWDRLLASEVWGGPPLTNQSAQVRPALGIHLDGRQSEPRILQINPGTPAERAGIREGDIVRALDGQPIENQADLARAILAKKPGDDVSITIDRGGETIQVVVKLAARLPSLPGSPPDQKDPQPTPPQEKSPQPESADQPPAGKPQPQQSVPPAGPGNPRRSSEKGPSQPQPQVGPAEEKQPHSGNRSERGPDPESGPGEGLPNGPNRPSKPATPDAPGRSLGLELDRTARHCLVARLVPDSPAQRAGMQPGDRILRIQNRPVTTPEDLGRLLAAVKTDSIRIVIQRAGRERILTISLNSTAIRNHHASP